MRHSLSSPEFRVSSQIRDFREKISKLADLPAGTLPKEFSDPFPENKGKLYSYSKGEVKILIEDVGLSNGLAWSRDNQTMFYVDSLPAKKMFAFDYSDAGEICEYKCIRKEPHSGL